MNEKEFRREMHDALNSYSVDLRFIETWYREIVKSLRSIKSRSRSIKHPRHLGDFLEEQVATVLSRMLPQRYEVAKGFSINYFSALSQEQDLLIIDSSLGSAVFKTEAVGYYPIECAVGGIEIKSNLSVQELRKCFISCVSVKKLALEEFDYADEESERFFYAIFAYSSSASRSSLEKALSDCAAATPETVRPNLIYVLDRGIYFPTQNGDILLQLDAIQKVEDGYQLIENDANDSMEAQNFFLFFSLLIQHAFHQSSLRKPVQYTQYAITPSVWRANMKGAGHKNLEPKKLINPNSIWSEKRDTFVLPIFEEVCGTCQALHKFFVLPPGTKKMRFTLEKNLRESGALPLPPLRRFKCTCGTNLVIQEAEGR